MAAVGSQLIEKVTAHAQSNSLEDARDICADSTYFPNNLRRNLNNELAMASVGPQRQNGEKKLRVKVQ